MSEPILAALLLFIFFSISTAADTLTSSRPLLDGETLVSANGTFALGFFGLPDTTNRYLGIWYHNLAVQTFVWVANRRKPLTDLNGRLSITNGSLRVLSFGKPEALWSSPSFPNYTPSPISQLLDSGNFIVKEAESNSILWQSFDYPTDTMLSGMKLGQDLIGGHDRNLTSWLSPSDPSPGRYTLAIDARGVPQMVIKTASGWFWRGGPWIGYGFSGAGTDHFYDVALYRLFVSGFVVSREEIYYYFNTVDGAFCTLAMDHSGTVRRYEWETSSQNWNLDWYAPNDDCDLFSLCGTNAICDKYSSPICRCIEGFDPRNPVNWGRGNWSDGCLRSAPLSCDANNTNEFVVVSGAKLPDTVEATVDMSIDLDSCRARCLLECSCNAYASADLSHGGNGCIMWTVEINDLKVYRTGGQDFYVRVSSISNPNGT